MTVFYLSTRDKLTFSSFIMTVRPCSTIDAPPLPFTSKKKGQRFRYPHIVLTTILSTNLTPIDTLTEKDRQTASQQVVGRRFQQWILVDNLLGQIAGELENMSILRQRGNT